MSLVLYIGEKPLTMKNTISFFGNHYSCKIIDIRNVDPELFLQSVDYKEVILALLAGSDNKAEKPLILKKIFIKLRKVLRFSDIELMEKMKEMEYLSQLRGKDIQQLILKEAQKMPVILDPKKSLFYKLETKQAKMEDATNFIKEGVALAIIHRSTGISMKELVKLQKKVQSPTP